MANETIDFLRWHESASKELQPQRSGWQKSDRNPWAKLSSFESEQPGDEVPPLRRILLQIQASSRPKVEAPPQADAEAEIEGQVADFTYTLL